MRNLPVQLGLLVFGAIALIGLIVLAAVGHLDTPTRETLQGIALTSLGAAAGAALPPAGGPQ